MLIKLRHGARVLRYDVYYITQSLFCSCDETRVGRQWDVPFLVSSHYPSIWDRDKYLQIS